MEVYKFAHEMQITSLLHAVNKFFKSIGPTSALQVFDFCILLDNKHGVEICKKVTKSLAF